MTIDPLDVDNASRKERRQHKRALRKFRRAEGCVDARTVYGLFVVMMLALVLGLVGYLNLIHRTQAVCEPLRFGQHAGERQATSKAGRDFAATFGGAADKLGCAR